MKVAVFSDVQGNIQAFEQAIAIIDAWQPDLVATAGDLINRGPDNHSCLALFEQRRRQHGWLAVRGNHEAWVSRWSREGARTPQEQAMFAFTDWTCRQLGELAQRLDHWPDHLCFDAPGDRPGCGADLWVHIAHGTLAGNRDGISPRTADESLQDKLPADLALYITGHTHKVHTRRVLGMDIVNVGSVGSPFDDDPRGSLGLFSFYRGRWHTEIRRFDYDREQSTRRFEESGFLDQGGPLAQVIFAEWQQARPLLAHWRHQYEAAVMAGEVDLQWSVDQFLRTEPQHNNNHR
ncbi:metallophosphoesterase family protein [Thiorhodovibrio frisius]|uniref:Putative phosphoesterase n=1 Tax=Thiorhodovibrio frisius TaxID=631362 RepID=H8Z4Z4_9GAMM|nr:metallophosphoesterase [Thiorhodovibrio frisius]EIC20401.1 putative phosphoesterase [Thiorhodovibrio frisius]WPL21142.1 phosphodiesterase [Thiorhodovibrio frisius]